MTDKICQKVTEAFDKVEEKLAEINSDKVGSFGLVSSVAKEYLTTTEGHNTITNLVTELRAYLNGASNPKFENIGMLVGGFTEEEKKEALAKINATLAEDPSAQV